MDLWLQRFARGETSTLGLLHEGNDFVCFTLEDEYRTRKVWGKTRIPSGDYVIELRPAGGMHKEYTERLGEAHRGMLWLRSLDPDNPEVPGFKWVYFHIGNRHQDSAGCILVGAVAYWVEGTGATQDSENAYLLLAGRIHKAMDRGELVRLTIWDEDSV